MSVQFPSEFKEKTMAHVRYLKHFRELYKDSIMKVQLIKGKVKVGSQVVENSFEATKLRSNPVSTFPPFNSFSHT